MVYEKPTTLQKKGSFQETAGSGPKEFTKERPSLDGKEKNQQWAKLGEMLRSQNGKKNIMSQGKLGLGSESLSQSRNIYDKRIEENKLNQSGTKSARVEQDDQQPEGQGGIKGMLRNFFS